MCSTYQHVFTASTPPLLVPCWQELSEYLGLVKLNARLAEPSLQDYFSGLFPQDTMQNMRFSINFFTSIGLGGITDRQRQLYKEVGFQCVCSCGVGGCLGFEGRGGLVCGSGCVKY